MTENYFNPQRLDIARMRRMMTRRELAIAVNITPVQLSKIMRSLKEPDDALVHRFAEALQWPRQWFFKRDIDMPNPDAVSF